ncbi:MAG: serine--tRNA ligase [Candidatus Omnitrophica bacterium 4484_70.2]|nr:MAG: serine--tRNA ligase [Candidatus Omnitrophica bacterium 4484_70.2]
MLDIKFIRQNVSLVKKVLEARNYSFDLESFLKLDEERRLLIKEVDNSRSQQNELNRKIKSLIKEKKDISLFLEETKKIAQKIDELEERLKMTKDRFQKELLRIPNIFHSSVPQGDASFNKIVKEVKKIRNFSFKPLAHMELGKHLELFSFPVASKLCGSNFVLFKKDGALLSRALINFMLDIHRKRGYQEIFPPFLVNRASMLTTGQLPNLEEDMYQLKDDDYFLVPTAEVPVTNIYRDEILEEDDLPLYFVSYTACFRREAGSYGKETKGLVRVHQFDKVELVKFVHPSTSYEELEKLVEDASYILELLELPYRVVLLSTQELSFAASKCYDLEVYAPGIERWLEVSSCSNFEDFQARRGNIHYREKKSGKLKYIHTLNGSGLALPRLIIALLENYQNSDGSVTIPQVLRKYMHGKEKLEK